MPEDVLHNWQKKYKDKQKHYKNFLARADKNKVLKELPQLHEEAFEKVDCLQCAACCKNYSPRFKTPDVKRISKHLGMKESAFIETYLRVIVKFEACKNHAILAQPAANSQIIQFPAKIMQELSCGSVPGSSAEVF